MPVTVDRRDLVNFTEYQQDRIEALKRRITELEEDLEYMNWVVLQRDHIIEELRRER